MYVESLDDRRQVILDRMKAERADRKAKEKAAAAAADAANSDSEGDLYC